MNILIFCLSLLKNANIESNIGTFLHITDIHIDPNYQPNTPTNCLGDAIGLACCNKLSIPLPHTNYSKYWGDKKCDIPIYTLTSTLKWINTNIDNINFILYGGDTIGHHEFSSSYRKNMKTMTTFSKVFNDSFPDIPKYSTQGNHDTFPIDQTPPSIITDFRSILSNQWDEYLTRDAIVNYTKYGYYYVKIENNLTLININSLDYDANNMFKIKDLKLDTQWQFLDDIMLYNKYDKFIILGHIFPYASESTMLYNTQLLNWMQKNKERILISLFGHTHNDEFHLYKVKSRTTPLTSDNLVSSMITPSFMPDGQDPRFRIYYYDKTTKEILDYLQYYVDLDESNNQNQLLVKVDYRFSEEYHQSSINIESLLDIYQKKDNNTYCKHYDGRNTIKTKCNMDIFQEILIDVS